MSLVFRVEYAGRLRRDPDHEVGEVGGLQRQPDPGRQVQVQHGQLRQQPLRLGLTVRELTQPLTDRYQRLEQGTHSNTIFFILFFKKGAVCVSFFVL